MKSKVKRGVFCCFLIIGILAIALTPVLAETLVLSQYTDEEILDLLKQVQAEIAVRGFEKTATLPSGRYVGGKDIPAGSYILTCKTDANQHGIVWLSAAKDNLEDDYPSKLYEHISFDREETFYIDVEEGGILNVPFMVQLTISGGILFR